MSKSEESEFNFLMAGIKPEYFDMAAGFETYVFFLKKMYAGCARVGFGI